MEKKEKNDSNQAEINLLQPMKWNEMKSYRYVLPRGRVQVCESD